MTVEIERKFLLSALPRMPQALDVVEIDQGYIPGTNVLERLRRQRSRDGTVRYFRTVKLGSGLERLEFEDETDAQTFEHLWLLTEGQRLQKRRYMVPAGDLTWEVDEFTDRRLHLAEVELPERDTQVIVPDWLKPVVVRDVTDERRYTNRSLAR
jgi:CYTH domain-containing protein